MRVPRGSSAHAVCGVSITPGGIAQAFSAPVVRSTRPTDCRLTPSTWVKWPPTNIELPSGASASDRTTEFVVGTHDVSEPSKPTAARCPRSCPSTFTNEPPR